MRRDRNAKEYWVVYILGALLVLLLAARLAPYLKEGLSGLLSGWQEIAARPFSFSWGEGSLKTMIVFLLLYTAGLGAFLASDRNYRRREEHGSAKWGRPENIRKKYADPVGRNNKILTQNVSLGLDARRHGRNLNVLVCGGSGSGKTRFFAKPNLMNASCSYVVLDPKIAVF